MPVIDRPTIAACFEGSGSAAVGQALWASVIAACNAILKAGVSDTKSLTFVYLRRCWAHHNHGDWSEAQADCGQAIQRSSNRPSAPAFEIRASDDDYLQQYSAAISDATNAIRLNPKNATSYVTRGLAYEYTGDKRRAVADLSEALRLNPKLAVQIRLWSRLMPAP